MMFLKRDFCSKVNLFFLVVILAVFWAGSIFAAGVTNFQLEVTPPIPDCMDGKDNDSDGLVDFPNDPGCVRFNDNDETDPPLPQCSDGIDNDGDYKVDLADPGCTSAADNDEVDFGPPQAPYAPGGGGGGGSVSLPEKTTLIITGQAYPLAQVFILKDGQIIDSTTALTDSTFTVTTTNVSSGDYIFSLYAKDKNGVRSRNVSLPVSLTKNSSTQVDDIIIPPTIFIFQSEVVLGEKLEVIGQSAPQTQVTLSIERTDGLQETGEQLLEKARFFHQVFSDVNGVYNFSLDTAQVGQGQFELKTKTVFHDLSESIYSYSYCPKVELKPSLIPEVPKAKILRGNINGDDKVNLIDFSIAVFWFKKELDQEIKEREALVLNGDGKIDLADFSIMAYYWTG